MSIGSISQAARDVLAERERQISAEGWTTAHDDEHGDGSMAVAAAYYALGRIEGKGRVIWPWDSKWLKLKDPRSNLVRAAALMLAEIERLDRKAARTRPDGFPTWICSRCTNPAYCSGSLQGCDIEEMSK